MGRDRRDRVRGEIRRLLTAGVSGHVFPGAAACVSWREGTSEAHVVACAGVSCKGGKKVADGTLYDLAAVTQPVVVATAVKLADEGKLDLGASVEAILPDARGGALRKATIADLLAHRAGLAGWGGLYLDVPHEIGSSAARRWIVSEAARRPLERAAGPLEPSDLGILIAGEAIARVCGAPLDRLVDREVAAPLGLSDQLFFQGALGPERRAEVAAEIAPTERCQWRGRLVHGEVHDENAAALGGVAAHAGLFGTALAVATFGRAVLEALAGRPSALPRAGLERSLAPLAKGSPLRMGWSMKHGDPAACGRRMGSRTFGQLGLTGTSIFCDPESDVVIALLTNRICPSRANEKIDGYRPAFHDGVMAALS